jgi:predicted NUDIX family phosphoesterase
MHVYRHISILNILSTSKLQIGEIALLGTHPRLISKYVFMRMHITGSIGTNGQMNPVEGAAERSCNIKLPVV